MSFENVDFCTDKSTKIIFSGYIFLKKLYNDEDGNTNFSWTLELTGTGSVHTAS
jgi:hypothetical protein